VYVHSCACACACAYALQLLIGVGLRYDSLVAETPWPWHGVWCLCIKGVGCALRALGACLCVGRRYSKYVKRLLSIHAAGENCVLATAADDAPNQYVLILCNAIGTVEARRVCAGGLAMRSSECPSRSEVLAVAHPRDDQAVLVASSWGPVAALVVFPHRTV
jgi:hypothetical protein